MGRNDDEKDILPPAKHATKDLVRGSVEAIVEMVPGVAILTAMYRETHPSGTDQSRDRWEGEVTDRSNSHGRRLDDHEQMLSPGPNMVDGIQAALLVALAKDCPDGMRMQYYDLEALEKLLPHALNQDIETAVFDLDDFGLFDLMRHLGGWRIRVTLNFYEQIDAQVMGWSTVDDAALIANLMLNDDKCTSVPKLFEHVGWPRRRLNPALGYLRQFVPEERISDPVQDQFEFWGLSLLEEDCAKFRRFIKSKKSADS